MPGTAIEKSVSALRQALAALLEECGQTALRSRGVRRVRT